MTEHLDSNCSNLPLFIISGLDLAAIRLIFVAGVHGLCSHARRRSICGLDMSMTIMNIRKISVAVTRAAISFAYTASIPRSECLPGLPESVPSSIFPQTHTGSVVSDD